MLLWVFISRLKHLCVNIKIKIENPTMYKQRTGCRVERVADNGTGKWNEMCGITGMKE